MTAIKSSAGSGTFAHGIHPPERKGLAADKTIEAMEIPAEVKIPMLQHVGAPCEATTKPRQELACGDVIGEAKAFVSAPIHATIDGVAGMPCAITLANGRRVKALPIKAGETQPTPKEIYEDVLGGEWPLAGLEQYAPDAIVEAIKSAGIVGQGGAAFPTFIKLMKNDEKPIDTILVNGCECEPYLTADYRLMVEVPNAVLCGAMLAARACGAQRVVVAVEDNKPLGIEALKKAAVETKVDIAVLQTKYPQGGEKQTVVAALGREIPSGGLPLDVGVGVINIGTAAAIARAVTRGKPLTHRVVTVSGEGIKTPKNLLVPIGMNVRELVEYCGGLKDEATKIIAGGPMMGFTLGDLDTPVTKGTSGITVLTDKDTQAVKETNCVRCGRCVGVCPMNLVPQKLGIASRRKNWEVAKKYNILSCVECGCCAYICPAGLELVQLIRMGKTLMPRD